MKIVYSQMPLTLWHLMNDESRRCYPEIPTDTYGDALKAAGPATIRKAAVRAAKKRQVALKQ